MLKRFVKIFSGDPTKRTIDKFTPLVDEINALEPQFEALSDAALREKTEEFRDRLNASLEGVEGEEELKRATQEALDELLPEAFAAVREASKRAIGLRHYDVQLIGGIVLHQSSIAEMRTGEGKTLVATLPVYLNALTGRGVHLITVNDYLARRDARWMAPIYQALGLSVGVLQMAARTENGKKAFLVDLEKESPHEDQHQLRLVDRAEAYAADITYGTNSEFGFDYLRDNMTMRLEDRVQRGHFFAIVDEVDNVLIDEARTPLIISGPAQDESEWYYKMAQVVRQLRPEDYELAERERTVTLTELGETHVEEILGLPLRDPERPEDITHEQARLLGYLEQALRAQFLFRRNKDYLVQAGKVVIVDEFTGRLMPGRRWSDGLHQAVEAKEGVKVEPENVTYATITIQNYFRMYTKLAGMTGTALTEAEEFDKIYKLEVVAIPTNLEYQANRSGAELEEVQGKDEYGYKYTFYARRDDPEKRPVYWRRKDYPDIVYRTEEAKLRALTQEILHSHVRGQPVLVGTTSVELSDRVSTRLRAEPLRRLAQVLLIRRAWFSQHNREEDGRGVPELQPLNAPLDGLDINLMRKMARDLGLSFNPEDPENLESLRLILNLRPEDDERLVASLKAGISHEVLNARKHTEESQIIAGAGAFGAVTIATNMAGRGVDIKLGGELAEELHAAVARVLKRAGHEEPYNMTLEERRQALQRMDPAEFGIYETEVSYFLQHIEDMQRVRELGGLHVIGSERHEARRIDNQLRGRAARQGDPGSSRFYLSMEDELMRLFGGQQADAMMQRLNIDDALPLEMGLVSRLVEQSQTRVEGANFDVRKHLLEYDDVLNTQRHKIYGQRNVIFKKEDLSEDVTDMLRTEVTSRVPEALKDEGGPWKLLSWLDAIQPPVQLEREYFPTYTQRLLVDYVLSGGQARPPYQRTPSNGGKRAGAARAAQPVSVSWLDAGQERTPAEEAVRHLVEIARGSIESEEEHTLRAVDELLAGTEERFDAQLQERMDALDTFFEGLSLEDEEEGAEPRSSRQIAEQLNAVARFPLKLSNDQTRRLLNEPEEVRPEVEAQVEAALKAQAVLRLLGAVERRLDEGLELNPASLAPLDWDEIAAQLLAAVQNVYRKRLQRLIDEGQIQRELESAIARLSGSDGSALADLSLSRKEVLHLLLLMPQGSRALFDRKTHRKVIQRTTRLSYTYYAARFLENQEPEDVAAEVLSHLEEAQEGMRLAWGAAEWKRLSGFSLSELDEKTQKGLQKVLDESLAFQVWEQPLNSLTEEERQVAVSELGRQALTRIYRQLLLQVITELWIDYLTQMEALRVSIGLEAYGQRDPLVQYKNRAFALFQQLLANMRLGVISRMFIYRPRDPGAVQAAVPAGRGEAEQAGENGAADGSGAASDSAAGEDAQAVAAPVGADAAEKPAAQPRQDGGGKKKRRRRR